MMGEGNGGVLALETIRGGDFCWTDRDVLFGALDGVCAGPRALLAAPGGPRAAVVWQPEGAALSTEREKELLLASLGVETLALLPGVHDAAAARALCGAGLRRCRVTEDGGTDAAGVRAAFAGGDFAAAAALLGGGYWLVGKVVPGKHAGSRHGMPTANLAYGADKLLPPPGVYGALARWGGRLYRGVTNVGRRPSDDDSPAVTVETLLSDFSGDLYGEELALELRFRLRGIRKFPGGLDDVRRQVERDAAEMNARMDAERPL